MYLLPPNETQLEFVKKEDVWQPAERVNEDVTDLIEWLAKQPHLPNITDRTWLAHFITGCKYNLQRSKQVIESYFVRRAECPEFLETFTAEQLKEAMKSGSVCLFPKLTPEGNRIFCTKTTKSDDDNFDIKLFCQVSLAVLDLHLKEEPMYGTIVLYDLKHVTLSQFLAFTPTLTKRLFSICLDSFPLRVKGVHYVNPPKFIGRLLTFFKMFVPTKIRERFFVHESFEDLQAHIPKDVLPEEYGGTCGNFKEYEESMLQLYEANKEWLDARPRADLSRRPGGHTNADELDMNGTFKQLQID